MLTNIQHVLLNNNCIQIFFDISFVLLQVLLVISVIKNNKFQSIIAIGTAVFNLVYCIFFSTMSFASIENFMAWMIVPLILYTRSINGFYYLMHIVRYIFILVFFSASFWKIIAGGLFNIDQMSGILYRQHVAYIACNNNDFYSSMISYLINHQTLSYCFYLLGFIVEFVFIIGFFTKKYDKLLIVLFCLFICFDYLIMGINYFTWLPFMGCLYFSKYQIKEG